MPSVIGGRYGLPDTDAADGERLQNLARQTVRQRWQICDEMAIRAGDFPADARKDY
jgi:hypothetical protein